MIVISTSKGDISLKLHEDTTPLTVENFRTYLKNEFFTGTIFHRVISGFMIQGGGLEKDLSSKTTLKPIKNEAKGALPNKRGTVAMARTGEPHSATAQFFINLADNAFLNFKSENPAEYGYCVFGEVVEGMDVVDAIAKEKTGNRMGHSDVPVEDIVILSVREELE
jgi:peptidyl-prolyl cis-trans isomerase B (cyclophilin B)